MAIDLIGKFLNSDELTLAVDELKVYQVENMEGMIETYKIDHYWRNGFSINCKDGSKKFPLSKKVVQVVLIIPHGNSDVERVFSENRRMIVTDGSELSEASLDALRTAKDTVLWYDPKNEKPENVPLTKDILKSTIAAHKSYQNRLEEQRQDEEAKERAGDLEKKDP